MDRRHLFKTTATLGLGALAGSALPGVAQNAAKTPFSVGATHLPSVGSDMVFPVRRIGCIGRNYAAHAREMGSDPTGEPPIFFQKPTDAVQNMATRTVAGQIAKLSEANELMPGAIIDLGTPENVGPVVRGDVIDRHTDGLPNLGIRIT